MTVDLSMIAVARYFALATVRRDMNRCAAYHRWDVKSNSDYFMGERRQQKTESIELIINFIAFFFV